MGLDDRLADRQAQAHAVGLGGEQMGEDLLHAGDVDPRGVVGDGDADQPRLRDRSRHLEHAPTAGDPLQGVDRVGDQIDRDLLHLDRIGPHLGQALGEVGLHLDRGALALDLGEAERLAQQGLDVDSLATAEVLGQHAARTAHHGAGALRIAGDALQGRAGFIQVGRALGQPAQGRLAVGHDRRDRLVDLVGDGGGEGGDRDHARRPGEFGQALAGGFLGGGAGLLGGAQLGPLLLERQGEGQFAAEAREQVELTVAEGVGLAGVDDQHPGRVAVGRERDGDAGTDAEADRLAPPEGERRLQQGVAHDEGLARADRLARGTGPLLDVAGPAEVEPLDVVDRPARAGDQTQRQARPVLHQPHRGGEVIVLAHDRLADPSDQGLEIRRADEGGGGAGEGGQRPVEPPEVAVRIGRHRRRKPTQAQVLVVRRR